MGLLSNPWDPNADLRADDTFASTGEPSAEASSPHADPHATAPAETDEAGLHGDEVVARAVENAVVAEVFGSDPSRRRFLQHVGTAAAAGLLASIFPLETAKAMALDPVGRLEKTDLTVGFVPITCSAPLIAADPLGFYAGNGLNVELVRTPGWAAARDRCLSGQYDACHLLAPMPLAMTLGLGSKAEDYVVAAMQNTNGQAIVLHNRYADRRDPQQWKGFKFGVPFTYSMHNFLLRTYAADHGLDPDRDIEIVNVAPPKMVATLASGEIDGYLAPDPFCQRAVYDEVGFIHMLTKEIWYQHPCCAFGASRRFATQAPNTFHALFRAVLESLDHCRDFRNRRSVAQTIAPAPYLGQPTEVVEQVLTGRYPDGLGNVRTDPDRIHFAPYPAKSMAVWILTQMKRWNMIKEDIDYAAVAEKVYLAAEAERLITKDFRKEIQFEHSSYTIMGREFDPAHPEAHTARDVRTG